MRRVPAGLAGLALATALASTVALSASAAAPDGSKAADSAAAHHVRRAAQPRRGEAARVARAAIQDVIAGRAKVEQRGASKVVRVGKQAAPQRKGKAAATEDQYVEFAREKRTRSS